MAGGYRPHGYELDRATGKLVPVDAEAPVPAMIFDPYVNERLGARAIGVRLNERGLRTKAGKPWNAEAVLTVLRNRVYLGEVYFRGTWYRAENHHPPVVDADLFEQAQQILIARGDDHARRAYVNSEYILAGHITCDHCGKRYLGTSAKGKLYRCRYYTCFTRQRYGPTPAQPNGSRPTRSSKPSSTTPSRPTSAPTSSTKRYAPSPPPSKECATPTG